jgi:hypothetical protein
MHLRKQMMARARRPVFIAMPGGIGTLEELYEVWTWRQLGYHDQRDQTAASSVSPVRMRTTCSTGRDEDLAVADLAGLGGLDDGLDAAVDVFVLDHHFHLHLGQEVDHVLGTAVQLGVALLAAEALDLGDGEAGHAHVAQRFTHLLQLERLDDGGDLFHARLRITGEG